MARRESRLTITSDDPNNRDVGKVFFLREMPAAQAEDWATRALMALTAAGAEVPDDVATGGMADLAMMGVQALSGLRHADIKPLLDEMFACVQICPDRQNPNVVRPLVEDDIEEVQTRFAIRRALMELHLGFSLGESRSELRSEAPRLFGGSRVTRTSPAQ